MPARVTIIAVTCLLAACMTSKERLTAKAVGCSSREVEVLQSDFSRRGVETAWCATCNDKLYRCATNPERSRVSCLESREGDGCR
jgi:hypothetical protein